MELGSSLFKFELLSTDGEMYSNYTFADRTALLIIISCNHCPYSRAYWSRIIKLYNKFEEDNLGVFVINPNDESQYPEDSYENMIKMSDQLGFPFPYLRDESQVVAQKLGATRTPEVFLFNSKRKLCYKGAIDDSWEDEHLVSRIYLEDAIEYTLDGMEPDFTEIPAVGCSIKWKK